MLTLTDVEAKLHNYLELQKKLQIIQDEMRRIKDELKSEGVGVIEPEVFEVDGLRIKVQKKITEREYFDREKARQLLSVDLYNQITKIRKVESYEIRVLRGGVNG